MNFGADLLLVAGEIVWEGDNLALASGEDNAKQQTELQVLTDLGEMVFYKDYGGRISSFLTGKTFTLENKVKAEAEVRSTLLKVGTVAGGEGWIENVKECSISLTEVDGKQAFTIFAKYLLRGDVVERELNVTIPEV
ncbi:DUF2634 domain-containing protein [Bacillus sp. 3255]|uniref:DUF2634 domain-containing protein n=1 Tax=Bacillus sp. 3255 TaxID=2817904 RepID=UPI0028669517|nr:DUF2634 domain-containing protein [Bacillus sp. 3255]MDR6883016.1 hypothetical protein [Bacillus sp. 3255]